MTKQKRAFILSLMCLAGSLAAAHAQENQGSARKAPPPGTQLYCGDNKMVNTAAECGITIPNAPQLHYVPVAGPVLPAGMERGGVAGVALETQLSALERRSTQTGSQASPTPLPPYALHWATAGLADRGLGCLGQRECVGAARFLRGARRCRRRRLHQRHA